MKATVLVVDDNEANRLLVQDTLEDEAYEVLMCAGGEEAVALFAEREPACVLLDVKMPGVDGFDTCERIRATAAGRTTPIIFLTALRDVDTFERALAVGGDDFLTKPLQPSELLRRVRTALEVRRLGAELHDQYELLRRQRDDLMRVHLQKERLMTFVVHDLKNPLNSMDLQAQVLLSEPDLPAGARAAALQIRTDAVVLGRMLTNLLDLSKSDEGKLTPVLVHIDLPAVLAAVLTELAPDAASHQVTLVSDVRVETLTADRELLRRILGNLIANAIRHAPAGTAVTVSAAECEGQIELRVRDAGAGVPAAMRTSIFEAFVQVDGDRLRARGGRGLGLTFCRIAVLAHHGHIWVEDAAPGAAFCVRFPRV